ncbi:hypothetical protein LWI29_030143 [Acer saccharum]|uniref:Uncharacterized protein n=1 Tax=Acer saccharum TaxID=4024 RepID=A0AA39VPE8_ACESA|nr:hypothetical protein LWI29_030143 [Acer saccharum]
MGTYDFTYVLKLFTRETLSNTTQEFAAKASTYLDKVVDLKLAAKYFKGLKDVEVDLLSRILHVGRFGEAHNVDSDSLLIARVYAKMIDHIEDGSLEGILCGLEDVKIRRKYKPYFMTPLPHPHPMHVQFVPFTFFAMSFRPRIQASTYLDKVVNLKLAAKYFKGLKDFEVGLLSRILHLRRLSEAHNADSNSLLIVQVYAKITDHIEDGCLEGILYRLEDVKIRRKYKPYFMTPLPHPHPMPMQFMPYAIYTMSFRPWIQVHWHGGNYHNAPMQPQPFYFMPVPLYVMV